MVLLVIVVASSVWIYITSKWAFSVTTDKSTYRLGENVRITVNLKNVGYITHSFNSRVVDPVIISITFFAAQVWYSPFNESNTEFSIEPNEFLERNFVWNQTNIHFPESEIDPGNYRIKAFIPRVSAGYISDDPVFQAYTGITIAAP